MIVATQVVAEKFPVMANIATSTVAAAAGVKLAVGPNGVVVVRLLINAGELAASTARVPPEARISIAAMPYVPGNAVDDPTRVDPGVPVTLVVLNAAPCEPPALMDAWLMIVHSGSAVNAVLAVSLASAPKTRLPAVVVVMFALNAVDEEATAGVPAIAALFRVWT